MGARPQFRLRTLFLVFVVVASTLAVFGSCSLFALPALFLIALFVRRSPYMKYPFLAYAALVIAISVPAMFVLSMEPQEPRRQSACSHGLEAIGRAVLAYYDQHGSLPSNLAGGPPGQPLLSWRLSLLPLLGDESERLYRSLSLKERWDSSKNRQVTGRRIGLFQCPSHESTTESPSVTHYVAVIGPHSVWSLGASADKEPALPANAIMVVEWPESDIAWAEPRDLSVEELFRPGSAVLARLRRAHFQSSGFFGQDQRGFHALFGDGTVHFISANVPDEVLKSLFAADGDRVAAKEDILESYRLQDASRVNYPNCAALLVWLFSAAAFIYGSSRAST